MNISEFLNQPRVRQVLTVSFLLGALACMFPPDSYSLKRWANHAEHIAVAYLLVAICFLVLNNSRLMFVCMGCSAAISFFLFETTSKKIKDAEPTNMPFVRLAHYNVNNCGGDAKAFMETALSRQPDLVSFQEVTPDWDSVLRREVAFRYPYYSSIPSLNTGIALFSKIPLKIVDTFYFGEMPNLAFCLRPDGFPRDIWVIASLVKPPLSGSAFENMKNHLEKISFYANKTVAPVITLGDYNAVSWSKELTNFRTATHLSDSRRGMKPSAPDGHFPLFNVPVDHIYYSSDFFECVKFESVSNKTVEQFGIEGTYQIKAASQK